MFYLRDAQAAHTFSDLPDFWKSIKIRKTRRLHSWSLEIFGVEQNEKIISKSTRVYRSLHRCAPVVTPVTESQPEYIQRIIWGSAANNPSYSRKFKVFSIRPRPFCNGWAGEAVRMIFHIFFIVPFIIFWPNVKIRFHLLKKCPNVSTLPPKSAISMIWSKYDAFTIQFPIDNVVFMLIYQKFRPSNTFGHFLRRWKRILTFGQKIMKDTIQNMWKIMRTASPAHPLQKGRGLIGNAFIFLE